MAAKGVEGGEVWGDSGSQRASSNEQWGEDYIFENASQACRIEDILMRLSSGVGCFMVD